MNGMVKFVNLLVLPSHEEYEKLKRSNSWHPREPMFDGDFQQMVASDQPFRVAWSPTAIPANLNIGTWHEDKDQQLSQRGDHASMTQRWNQFFKVYDEDSFYRAFHGEDPDWTGHGADHMEPAEDSDDSSSDVSTETEWQRAIASGHVQIPQAIPQNQDDEMEHSSASCETCTDPEEEMEPCLEHSTLWPAWEPTEI